MSAPVWGQGKKPVKLPTKFNPTIVPIVEKSWLHLMPHRDGAFWWRVGVVVKLRKIKRNDLEKVEEVCKAVDNRYPDHNKKGRIEHDYRNPYLPSYEYIFRGKKRKHTWSTCRCPSYDEPSGKRQVSKLCMRCRLAIGTVFLDERW